MSKNWIRTIGVALLLLGATLPATAQWVVKIRPVTPVVRVRPTCPGPSHLWVDGNWVWRNGQYVWTNGYWATPPRPGNHWRSGHWKATRQGWVWVPGHWTKRRW